MFERVKQLLLVFESVDAVGVVPAEPALARGVLLGELDLVRANEGGRVLVVANTAGFEFKVETPSVVIVHCRHTPATDKVLVEDL